jgi:ABC-type transport system involved in multi-copper enzyme maturation permease subunit
LLGPIFNREWLTLPRRSRHYVNRAAYLGLLWILGLTAWQATVGWGRTATLGDTARFGLLLFEILAVVQLILLPFFAALSSASAITLEKDRRTFVLLLMTDLRNHEIVLGKLFGSLLQMLLLLLGTIPLLALLLLLGGIAPHQLAEVVIILAATVLAAGSLGNLIALWRDKTFQALALTVLFLVLYVCLVHSLPAFFAVLGPGLVALLLVQLAPARLRARAVLPALAGALVAAGGLFWVLNDWGELRRAEPLLRSWMYPYEALKSVLNPPTEAAIVPAAYGCAAVMVLFSVLLNAWAVGWLRVWNPSGEPIMQREQADEEAEEKDRARAHAAPGAVRRVWANPILWREVATRAYGRRPFLVKVAYFIALGLICYYALAPLLRGTDRPEFAAARGLVPVGVLSLLLLSAQAVTAITSERDTGALDLLLVTDLTPKEFIFGKIGGICYNAKEYLLPPLILAVVYGVLGLLATPPHGHPELLAARNTESLVCVIGTAVVMLAFALLLGMHVALLTKNSRLAIINTLGTIFFLSVGTLICIYLILINGRFEYQWASFVLFIMAGIGGLWWVLSGERPSAALTLASWLCPLAVFYSVTNILVARPGTQESSDPWVPFLVMGGAFGFTVAAMLIPLLSEFDVALGRTTGGAD